MERGLYLFWGIGIFIKKNKENITIGKRDKMKGRAIVVGLMLSAVLSMQSFAATEIGLNLNWKYAKNAKINTGKAILYTSDSKNPKKITIAVNAGHGTKGGEKVRTLCHPDGTRKVTGGTNAAGSTTALAVSSGMTFKDGTKEATVTGQMGHIFAKKLLSAGYDVLLIRDGDDVQLDNVARTVLANNKADAHIALHWDSTEKDKGAFFMSVPDSLKKMEPVASHWESHEKLGESLIAGLKGKGVKIFSSGNMDMDLTQTSYSTVPSVDIELGDKISDHSEKQLNLLGDALVDGVNKYYGFTS